MDESISEMDVVFARKEATLDPKIVLKAKLRARKYLDRKKKRMLELAVGMSTDLYIINTESQKTVRFKDVKLDMNDIYKAVMECQGCSLDEPKDIYRFLQTTLDIIEEKRDSEDLRDGSSSG